MSTSAKQLIQKAVNAAGGQQATEAKALERFITDAQSTHINEAEDSVFNSTVQLHTLYKDRLEQETHQILGEITKYIESLQDPLKQEARDAYARVVSISSDAYGRLVSQRGLSLTARDALVLAWIGATDPQAMQETKLSEQDIEDRKLTVIKMLRQTNNEYGPGKPACYGGTFHGLINSLNGVHQCVVMLLDEKQAFSFATQGLKLQVKGLFDTKSLEEKKAIFHAWRRMNEPFLEEKDEEPEQRAAREKEYEEQCKPALAFIEEAGQYVRERLAVQYKKDKHTNYLSGDQIDGLVASIPYLNQIDLINPHIYDQLKQKTKELFNALEDKEDKRKIIADWKTQAGAAMPFITTVEKWFYQDPSYLELLQFLTPDEVGTIRRSITQIEDHELDPTFSNAEVSASTAEADRALLDNPNNFNFLSKQNALTAVAEEYTVKKGYRDVLKKLLGMVSASAVAEAVTSAARYGNNALMLAAKHQNAENFMALVNKLFETPAGQQALLSTMALANQDGNNLLMLVTKHQITSSFKAFVDKVWTMEGGPEALRKSMSQMNSEKKNALMLMMEYQAKGGAVAFINQLFGVENGPETIIKSFEQSIQRKAHRSDWNENAFMRAVSLLVDEDFIALLKTLSSTEEGKEVLTRLMKHTRPDGVNVFALAAIKQCNGGFRTLMDTVWKLNDGPEILRQSSRFMLDADGNLAICVAQKQTSDDFIAYIEKLLDVKDGPQILIKLITESNLIFSVAHKQTNGGLILFMQALLSIENGRIAFLQAMQKNDRGITPYLLAAKFQNASSFILFMRDFFEILKSEPKVLQNLIRNGCNTEDKGYVDLFSLTAEFQKDEGFIALIDNILSMENGPNTLVELLKHDRLKPDLDTNRLLIAVRHQRGDGFIYLIDKLLNIPNGDSVIRKSLSEKLYLDSVRYQTPKNFAAFVDKVLNISFFKADIVTSWTPCVADADNPDTIVEYIRALHKHDFVLKGRDLSVFIARLETNPKIPTHVHANLIEYAKNPSMIPEKTSAEIKESEIRAPERPHDLEVKIHLPPELPETKGPIVEAGEDIDLQRALLANFFLNKPQQPAAAMPAVAPDEAEFKKSLQPFIEELRKAQENATNDLGVIQTVLNQVRVVINEAKPGEKQAEVNSLFTLRAKIVTEERSFETLPLAVQHVLSSIEKFRESIATPAPPKGKPLLPNT